MSKRLTHFGPGGVAISPSWSPDGRMIAFECVYQGEATSDICILDVTSGEISRLIQSERSEWRPIWSPDGEWILFMRHSPQELVIMHPDGTDVHEISLQDYEEAIGWILIK